jgi:DNA-binding transcriptional LysR family regulator
MQELLKKVSLEELYTFVAVVEEHSFVAGAKSIAKDATIVSRRIGHLEKVLGVRLLSRTTRRVLLTEAGALYYQRVCAIIDELENANLEASNFAASPRGLLRVSLPVTFGRHWVTPLLPRFIENHPDIRIEARFADRYVDIVAEGFDVAIRLGVLQDSSLIARQIATFQNLLYASPKYLKTHGQPEVPKDLEAHSCLGFTNHTSWPDWNLTCRESHTIVRPYGPLVADNAETLLHSAIAGTGVILTPDWLAATAVNEGLLVQILPGWRGSKEGGIYAVMPPGRLTPAKTRVFIEEITHSIQSTWST